MGSYEEDLAILQAEAQATLQRDLAAAKVVRDPLNHDQRSFINLLTRVRLAQKLSQAELAVRAGMPQSVIARIESNRGNPSLRTLLAIAKALDVHLVLE